MIRGPRRPPPFPCTALFRSVEADMRVIVEATGIDEPPAELIRDVTSREFEFMASRVRLHDDALPRSEEHTSELQSRQYLVCRLLLEKKLRYVTAHDVCVNTD